MPKDQLLNCLIVELQVRKQFFSLQIVMAIKIIFVFTIKIEKVKFALSITNKVEIINHEYLQKAF